MTEAEAEKHLRAILGAYTNGAALHLLADLLRDTAGRAHRAGDDTVSQQYTEAASVLYVVGLGIDATCPHSLRGHRQKPRPSPLTPS